MEPNSHLHRGQIEKEAQETFDSQFEGESMMANLFKGMGQMLGSGTGTCIKRKAGDY